MLDLRENATKDEIEDEMTFVQVSLESIDDDAADAAATRQELEGQMQLLEQRLQALENPAGLNRPATPETTVTASLDGANLPSRKRERRSYSTRGPGKEWSLCKM